MHADIKDLLPRLTSKFIDDWNKYNKNMGHTFGLDSYSIDYDFGAKFARIIVQNHGSRSCAGFICLVDNGKFKRGDLLKAASWKAPAKNFSRGSIFDLDNAQIRWTGVY